MHELARVDYEDVKTCENYEVENDLPDVPRPSISPGLAHDGVHTHKKHRLRREGGRHPVRPALELTFPYATACQVYYKDDEEADVELQDLDARPKDEAPLRLAEQYR